VPTQHIEASYFDVSDVLRVVRNIDVIAEFARRALPTLFEFVDALLTRDRRRGDADVIESLLLVRCRSSSASCFCRIASTRRSLGSAIRYIE